MTLTTDRLPAWTVVVPFVARGVDLALHGGSGGLAAGALIASLATWLFLIVVP